MAVARDLKSEKNHVIAVIGDGAERHGLRGYEQCWCGELKLLVVLNDNDMSMPQL